LMNLGKPYLLLNSRMASPNNLFFILIVYAQDQESF
jgi:hypothetical protein